jgi:hypothetical protein
VEALPDPEPLVCGSSFVDVTLKVAVQQDAGTTIAFKPEYLHGTALSHGEGNSIVAITFSRRVSDAWLEAQECEGKPFILQEVSQGGALA